MDKKIIAHLSKDKRLKKAITTLELPNLKGTITDVYTALIRSIIFQQLSGKAATTIYNRFLALFKDAYPEPKKLLLFSLEELRAVGVSRQKAGYVQNVAEFFVQEKCAKKDWSKMTDEEIITYLTQIKGVGKWTVQMLLMFTLERTDVFSIDDLGVQLGIKDLYDLEETGKDLKKRMVEIAEPWRPYRTVASRYIWLWRDKPKE